MSTGTTRAKKQALVFLLTLDQSAHITGLYMLRADVTVSKKLY